MEQVGGGEIIIRSELFTNAWKLLSTNEAIVIAGYSLGFLRGLREMLLIIRCLLF